MSLTPQAWPYKCDNCGIPAPNEPRETRTPYPGWWWLEGPETQTDLCSLECLMEWAWKLREQQPKLSKSRR